MTGLLLLFMVGCGDGSPAVSSTTVASSPATSAPTPTPETSTTLEAPTSTTAADEPAGQVETTVSVSSTNGGYPTEDVPDWSKVKFVGAFRDASYGVASLFVLLATDDVSAESFAEYRKLPKPAPGEGRIKLVLTRTARDVNLPPHVTGKYDFTASQGSAELTGEAGIVLTGSTITFSPGMEMESDVEITAVSDTEVAGTFYVKDKWSEISGTFAGPVK